MEQVTLEEATKELIAQLETTLGRLAMAADSGLSTYGLEGTAKKLAGKLKASAALFGSAPIYKNIKGTKVWNTESADFSENLFSKYAGLSKTCGEALDVYQEDNKYFAKVSKDLFINLQDLPSRPIPKFKVKIEGRTLMAISTDLYEKLPTGVQELLTEGGDTNEGP